MKTLSVINDENMLVNKLQQLAPELSHNEIKIYVSSIKHQKLSEIEDVNTFLRFQQTIDMWAKLLGLAKPDPQELLETTEAISNLYPNFTLNDLEVSINLYLRTELEVEDKPYGRLSIYFITRVLNAYKSYRSKSIVNARQAVEKHDKTTTTAPDDSQRIETFKEFLKIAKSISDSGEMYLDLGHRLFDYITKNKLTIITQKRWDEKLQQAEELVKAEAKKQYVKQYMGSLIAGETNNLKNNTAQEVDLVKKQTTAKRIIVNEWLKKIDIIGELQEVTIDKILK